MVEPTETENKETLDAFADAMLQIAKECRRAARARSGGPARDAGQAAGRGPGGQEPGRCGRSSGSPRRPRRRCEAAPPMRRRSPRCISSAQSSATMLSPSSRRAVASASSPGLGGSSSSWRSSSSTPSGRRWAPKRRGHGCAPHQVLGAGRSRVPSSSTCRGKTMMPAAAAGSSSRAGGSSTGSTSAGRPSSVSPMKPSVPVVARRREPVSGVLDDHLDLDLHRPAHRHHPGGEVDGEPTGTGRGSSPGTADDHHLAPAVPRGGKSPRRWPAARARRRRRACRGGSRRQARRTPRSGSRGRRPSARRTVHPGAVRRGASP